MGHHTCAPIGVMVSIRFKPENFAIFKVLMNRFIAMAGNDDYTMFVSPSLESDGLQPLVYGEEYEHEDDSWENGIRQSAENKQAYDSFCEEVEGQDAELVFIRQIMKPEVWGMRHMQNPISMSHNDPISPEVVIDKIQESVTEFKTLGVPSELIGMNGIIWESS